MNLHLRRTRTRPLAAVAVALVLLPASACRDPEIPTGSADEQDEDASDVPSPGPAASLPDPRDAELAAAGRDLLATLTDAATAFDQLTRIDEAEEAGAVARRLLAVLVADPRWADVDGDGEPDEVGVRSLLPGPLTSREETVDYGDAFTAVMSSARAAGPSGAAFVDVLRDPITSDLGTWQRDPQGLLDEVDETVRRVGTVEAAEAAIAELRGEAVRALAWALLATRAASSEKLDLVQAYGARGVVHVELMLEAVRPLLAEGQPTDDA